MTDLARFALGTAQLGMRYGAVNTAGQPSLEEARVMLDMAAGEGIGLIDTAQAYGSSEDVIGAWVGGRSGDSPEVVTKLDPAVDASDGDAVVTAVEASRRRLGRVPYAVLLHDASQIEYAADGLGACVDFGLAGAAGVSTYTPDEFEAALGQPVIAVIQAPVNALDRRLVDSGLLRRAAESGRRVMIRSVFLQGLLATAPDALPERVAHARPAVEAWAELCARLGADPPAVAIAYVRAAAPGASIVIGCDTAVQLRANIQAWRADVDPEAVVAAVAELPPIDERVIDPRRWEETL